MKLSLLRTVSLSTKQRTINPEKRARTGAPRTLHHPEYQQRREVALQGKPDVGDEVEAQREEVYGAATGLVRRIPEERRRDAGDHHVSRDGQVDERHGHVQAMRYRGYGGVEDEAAHRREHARECSQGYYPSLLA